MKDCALNDSLEPQGRLRVDLAAALQRWRVFVDEGRQFLAQLIHVGCAGTQYLGCRRIVEQGKKQMHGG